MPGLGRYRAGAMFLAALLALTLTIRGHAQTPATPAPTAPPADTPPPVAVTPAHPPRLVELMNQDYPVARTVDALEAPIVGAATLIRVHEGAAVRVVGVLEGNAWYQIELPDGRQAFVPADAIPAATAPSDAATAPPPAAKSVVEPTVAAPDAAPPPSTGGADDTETTPVAATTEFEAADQAFTVVSRTPVFVAPNEKAPQEYMVDPGRVVEVIAKSKDGAWAWTTTADGSPAYLLMSDLAPAD